MYQKSIEELKNQIRIIDQKLPSIDESIKTYGQMTKNYEKEKEDMLAKKHDYQMTIMCLERMEEDDGK